MTSHSFVTYVPIISFTNFDLRLGLRDGSLAHISVSSNLTSASPFLSRALIVVPLLPQHIRPNRFNWLSRYSHLSSCIYMAFNYWTFSCTGFQSLLQLKVVFLYLC